MSAQPTILITDDDPDLLFSYARTLKSAGYETVEAASGAQCMELARQTLPDLVLLDLMLPDTNGIAVCQQMKTIPPLARTLVILVSGIAMSADQQADALEAGVDGYLTKPVQPRMLLAQVRAMMRIQRAEASLIDQQEREIASLAGLSSPLRASITAQSYGVGPLRNLAAGPFGEMVDRYGQILELALEERAYKVEHNVSESLRALAGNLGFLHAGPRDVVDLHGTALKNKLSASPAAKKRAYVEEGRLRVLELMGYLTSYYRSHAIGAVRPRHTGAPSAEEDQVHE